MSTLHGEPVYPGDCVYDLIDGRGTVESVTQGCIFVTTGARTKRRYTKDGFTGKRTTPTLEWHRPPRVRFSKDCKTAEAQRRFLEQSVQLMNSVSCDCSCDTEVIDCPEAPCGCNGGCNACC